MRCARRPATATSSSSMTARYEAEQVVVATGPFQTPFVPPIAEGLDPASSRCTAPPTGRRESIPQGRVLVVGGGNTGFQIAEELSASHEVHLSVGSRQTPLPQRILGRDLFWYLEETGLIRKTDRVADRSADAAARDTLIGSTPGALRAGMASSFTRRAIGAAGSTRRNSATARAGCGRGDLGHRLPSRSLVDRCARVRRGRRRRCTSAA